MREKKDNVIHLPDLSFVQWCEKSYGLNRGVYNTIDAWFYENGTKDILKRRKLIVYFLNHYKQDQYDGKRIKFGHGRLTSLLSEYSNRKAE
jgi:riboflavin kinase